MGSNEQLKGNGIERGQTGVIDFAVDVEVLSEQLTGMDIVLSGTDKRVRIDEAQAWPYRERPNLRSTGKQYTNVLRSEDTRFVPGEVWGALARGGTTQFIIAAQEDGELGPCVRVRRVSRFDGTTQDYVPLENENDLALYFGIRKHEVLRISPEISDNTITLSRTGDFITREPISRINLRTSDELLSDLMES